MNLLSRNFFLDDFFDNLERERVSDMKCDIYEEEKNYVVLVDVPGYQKDDIFIDISRGYLTIGLVSNDENSFEDRSYIRKERVFSNVKRQFYVGDVDDGNVKASLNDGVLKIVFPKSEDNVDKKIIEIE